MRLDPQYCNLFLWIANEGSSSILLPGVFRPRAFYRSLKSFLKSLLSWFCVWVPKIWPLMILIVLEDLHLVLRGAGGRRSGGTPTRAPPQALQVTFNRCGSPPGLQTPSQRGNCRERSIWGCAVFAGSGVEEEWLTAESQAQTDSCLSPARAVLPPFTPPRLTGLQTSLKPSNDANPGKTNVCSYLSSRWQHPLPYEI